MRVNSPAKINLSFKVLAKRPDGYHEIASLFQAIDLCDRLFFSFSDSDKLTCSDPEIPLGSSNLVSKALSFFPSRPPVSIHIEKNIPIQAGLGGGSSNAATTLWALNELLGKPYTQDQLISFGAQIGSDVPFFFSSGTAYCTGRGEILHPALPQFLKGYIAKPFYGLSTPLVYQEVNLSQLPSQEGKYFNDLEIPAFRLEPRLRSLQTKLQKNFGVVTMTGSGTAFFCLGGDPKPIEGVQFFPFHTIQRREPLAWYEESDTLSGL